jgi:hypothetical protein
LINKPSPRTSSCFGPTDVRNIAILPPSSETVGPLLGGPGDPGEAVPLRGEGNLTRARRLPDRRMAQQRDLPRCSLGQREFVVVTVWSTVNARSCGGLSRGP